MSSNNVTEDQMKAFEERLVNKLTKIEMEEVKRVETLCQEYLRRTGRKETKP